MTLHILDTYSVIELETLLRPGPTRQRVFDHLTSGIESGELSFPDAVLAECRSYATGEAGTIWLAGVASSRRAGLSRFQGNMGTRILRRVPELIAVDDPGEQSQVAVACLAFAQKQSGADVKVITDDAGLGGSRMTLSDACGVLALDCCTMRGYLDEVGLGACLN